MLMCLSFRVCFNVNRLFSVFAAVCIRCLQTDVLPSTGLECVEAEPVMKHCGFVRSAQIIFFCLPIISVPKYNSINVTVVIDNFLCL